MSNKDRYWDCLDHAMEASDSGRTTDALAWLDEALKERPGGAEAFNSRGEVLQDAERNDEALHQFECATEADPKFFAGWLNQFELLMEMGQFKRVIERCDRLLSGEGGMPFLHRDQEAELYYLKAKALFYCEDYDAALFLARRATKLQPDYSPFQTFKGQLLFDLGLFQDAYRAFQHAARLDPDSSDAAYYFALAAERLGLADEARRAFARAHALDPEVWKLPGRFDDKSFERAVQRALESLPRSIYEYVERVPVMVHDWPDAEMIESDGLLPRDLGVFIGVPSTEAEPSQPNTDLDRIFLFRRNLEKECSTHAELVEAIAVTVKHEIGHYLGYDEKALQRLGLD